MGLMPVLKIDEATALLIKHGVKTQIRRAVKKDPGHRSSPIGAVGDIVTTSVDGLSIKITDVKIQQLQDISEEDAIAEGIIINKGLLNENCYYDYFEKHDRSPLLFSAKDSFCTYWANKVDKIESWEEFHHSDHSWHQNPLVWVVTFEVVK